MAPEVFQRTRPYSAAADIFSLALVFSELLTLQIPFAGIGTHAGAAASMSMDQARPCLPHNCIEGLKHLIGQGETRNLGGISIYLLSPYSTALQLQLTGIAGISSTFFLAWDQDPDQRPTAESLAVTLGSILVNMADTQTVTDPHTCEVAHASDPLCRTFWQQLPRLPVQVPASTQGSRNENIHLSLAPGFAPTGEGKQTRAGRSALDAALGQSGYVDEMWTGPRSSGSSPPTANGYHTLLSPTGSSSPQQPASTTPPSGEETPFKFQSHPPEGAALPLTQAFRGGHAASTVTTPYLVADGRLSDPLAAASATSSTSPPTPVVFEQAEVHRAANPVRPATHASARAAIDAEDCIRPAPRAGTGSGASLSAPHLPAAQHTRTTASTPLPRSSSRRAASLKSVSHHSVV